MKTINELRSYVNESSNNFDDQVMIQLCGNDHPLTDFLVECYKKEHRDKVVELTEENIIAAMQNYIEFAIEKAENQRGISAGRSMWKFKQWLWVLEDDTFDAALDNYMDYGLSVLKDIKEKYKLEDTPDEQK